MSTKPTTLSLSDALDLGRLAIDAADGLTGVVEHMHMSILDTPGFAPLAQGATRMCNNTANRVSVALAYTDGQGWVSEGWWNLKALDCATLLRGALAAQYYYVYAMDERGGEWKGKAFMCTTDREFKVEGRQDCFMRGYDRTGFFEVDTGKDAKSWTVQLTDQPNSSNP